MKKIVFFLFVFSLICATGFTAHAGDLPEAILAMPDVDVFIGEIIEIGDGTVKIDVSHALFDCYEVDTITVDEFEYMTLDDAIRSPELGDYIAVAAEYSNNGWKIAFQDENTPLVAKSDGLEPETLTLYSGGHGFVERMNGYINDETYSYENRSKIFNETGVKAGDEQESVEEGIPKTAQEPYSKVAMNTEIVLSPPLPVNAAPQGFGETIAYWYDKPYIKYPFITLLSAVVSYTMTKRIACRLEGKKR